MHCVINNICSYNKRFFVNILADYDVDENGVTGLTIM